MFGSKRVALVLGGGGMRGLAHIGVLKVLSRNGIIPDLYIGTSVGALVAAMASGGMMPEDIERQGRSLRRRDILDYNWWGMLFRRGRSRSIYKGERLAETIRRILPVDRWEEILKPLYINSVDLNTGQEVFWGMEGFTDVPIHDCVAASCSIPGIFPPREIKRRHYVDGGVIDSLPLKVGVYLGADIIIAVDLERDPATPPRGIERKGMIAILDQAQSILSRTLHHLHLKLYKEAPIVMIEPAVENHGVFQFDRTSEIIEAGEYAAERAVMDHPLLHGATRVRDATPRPDDLPPPQEVPRPDIQAA